MKRLSVRPRRQFLIQASAALGYLHSTAKGQDREPVLELAMDLPSFELRDVAPDGFRMCLSGSGNRAEQAVQIANLGSPYRVDFTIPLRAGARRASFFSDSRRIFIWTQYLRLDRDRFEQRMVFDLDSGESDSGIFPVGPGLPSQSSFLFALQGNALLGILDYPRQSTNEVLIRASFPEYSEESRATFRPDGQPYERRSDSYISADRTTFAHSVDNLIVCRRSSDLSVLWSQEIDPGMTLVPRLSVSARGDWVAAAVVRESILPRLRRFYVNIHDGESGAETRRFGLDAAEGLAISPDGRHLAVTRPDNIRGFDVVDMSIDVYDITSGQRIATALHDHYERRKSPSGLDSFGQEGVVFSSTGKYLVSSTLDRVKVWRFRA